MANILITYENTISVNNNTLVNADKVIKALRDNNHNVIIKYDNEPVEVTLDLIIDRLSLGCPLIWNHTILQYVPNWKDIEFLLRKRGFLT